jgi:hypothetical protein
VGEVAIQHLAPVFPRGAPLLLCRALDKFLKIYRIKTLRDLEP